MCPLPRKDKNETVELSSLSHVMLMVVIGFLIQHHPTKIGLQYSKKLIFENFLMEDGGVCSIDGKYIP
ncbi:hypothetical protein CR513_07374, partial [Mucuna pruriens]